MTPPSPEPEKQPRDTAYWAEEASVLKVERAPTGALNLNVEGHEVLSPLQGFGQLWQKVYQDFSISQQGGIVPERGQMREEVDAGADAAEGSDAQ